MIKEMIALTLFMIMNIFVIMGILLQFEQNLKEDKTPAERILLQTNENEKNEVLKTIKSKSGNKATIDYTN